MLPGLTYLIGRSLYVSITNHSPCLSLLESRGPGFAFLRSFVLLEREPDADEVVNGVLLHEGDWDRRTVTFAGAGDPLMRKAVLMEALQRLSERYECRVNTSGLFDPACAVELRHAGAAAVSIALNAADAPTYEASMAVDGFYRAVGFAKACTNAGLRTELTCVERDDARPDEVERMAVSMGCSFRRRSYFP